MRDFPEQRLLSEQNNSVSNDHLVVINQEDVEDDRNCMPFELADAAGKSIFPAAVNTGAYTDRLD